MSALPLHPADPPPVAWVVVAVGLVVLVGAMGTIVATDDDPDGDSLVETTFEQQPESVHGVRTISVESGGETVETTIRVWERPPTDHRSEVLSSTGAESPGDLIVSNSSTTWTYDAETNEAVRIAHDDSEPDPAATRPDAETIRSSYDVEYRGTETVGGVETHVVELTPTENRSLDRAIVLTVGDAEYALSVGDPDDSADDHTVGVETLWIDPDTGYWLQQRVETAGAGDEPMTITTTYEKLSVDDGISDDQFDYVPPENATVLEPPRHETFDDRDQLAEASPIPVPDPDLPPSAELDDAALEYSDGNATVSLLYDSADGPLWIAVSETELSVTDAGDPRETDVGAVNGTLVEFPTMSAIVWECSGYHYDVSAQLPDRELVEFAESVGCQR